MLILLLVSFGATAQTGHQITLSIKPLQNQSVYIGHYYGRSTLIIDSVRLDENSVGVLKGDKTLGQGIYFLAYANRSLVLPFLINENQTFSIEADTTRSKAFTFSGSPENTRFAVYQDSVRKQNTGIQGLLQKLMAKSPDSLAIRQQLDRRSDALQAYRKHTIASYPNTLLSDILRVMLDPEIPPALASSTDPMAPTRYLKEHYWDAVKFYDDRMLRTHFFEPKLDFYFSQLVVPVADSVTTEIDRIMASAVANKETRAFMLRYFLNRYDRPKASWGDRVFVHLYDRYIANREDEWLTEPIRKAVTDRAYSLMATTKGKPATDIELADRRGQKTSLTRLQAPYTLLLFWSPTCGHCQAMLPVLDSLYRAKWKAQGFKIFAVGLESDGTIKDWTSTIDAQKLTDWTHVYYTPAEAKTRQDKGLPDFARAYDVYSYPTLYLLDQEKHIMARKITLAEIDKILQEKQKSRE